MTHTNSEWRAGWTVVLAASLGMGTSYGLLMMTSGLFLKPMQADFGWSRAALSFLPLISLVSALMLPLTGYLLDRFGARIIGIIGLLALILSEGWRTGFLTLAGITLLVGLPPVLLFFRERPRAEHDHTTATQRVGFRVALTDRRFWLLFACFALVSIPLGGFMIHLVPILTDKGIDSTTAAMVGSVFALSIAVGRVAAGFLLDRLSPPVVASFCFLMPVVGVLLLNDIHTGLEGAGLLAGVAGALIGLAQGAEADFIAYFTARYFPLEMYSRVFSLIAMGTYSTISLGGLLFARLHDHFGEHQIAMFIALGCYSSAALGILFVNKVQGPLTRRLLTDSFGHVS